MLFSYGAKEFFEVSIYVRSNTMFLRNQTLQGVNFMDHISLLRALAILRKYVVFLSPSEAKWHVIFVSA